MGVPLGSTCGWHIHGGLSSPPAPAPPLPRGLEPFRPTSSFLQYSGWLARRDFLREQVPVGKGLLGLVPVISRASPVASLGVTSWERTGHRSREAWVLGPPMQQSTRGALRVVAGGRSDWLRAGHTRLPPEAQRQGQWVTESFHRSCSARRRLLCKIVSSSSWEASKGAWTTSWWGWAESGSWSK